MQPNYWGEYIPYLPGSAPLARLLGLRASIPQKESSSTTTIHGRIKNLGVSENFSPRPIFFAVADLKNSVWANFENLEDKPGL